MQRPFLVGGETLDLPCDPSGLPANTFNCRCRVEYQRLQKNAETGEWDPSPISYGDKAYLTDEEIAIIVYNEQGSFRGSEWDSLARHTIHSILNGEERSGASRPKTAREYFEKHSDRTQQVNQYLERIARILGHVRAERHSGVDPTFGLDHYTHRKLSWFTDSFDTMMSTPHRKYGWHPVNAIGPILDSINSGEGSNDDWYLVIYREE